MDHEEISFAVTVLLDYLDRRGPEGEEAQDICRQLLPFVVRETGTLSTAELASRTARQQEIEEALLRLRGKGGSAGWLLGRLAAGDRRPAGRSGVAPAAGGMWQQVEGHGNVNLQVRESVHGGLTIGLPPQPPPSPTSEESRRPVRDSEPAAPAPREDLPPRAKAEPVLRADLEIRVLEGFADGHSCLTFEVTAKDPAWRLDRKSFGPVPLRADPATFVGVLYERLSKAPSGQDRETEIRALGADLGRQLLGSGELLALLWSLQHRVTTVLLVSDEPWIPWELVRLEDPAGAGSGAGRFLCEAFALARWLPGPAPALELPLRRLALVASEADGQIAVREEREFIERQQGVARSVCSVPARFEPLLEALASGGYDGWHFCGHGGVPKDPDPNLLFLPLDDHRTLTPRILGSEAAGLGRSRPLVFLNACHTGRGGFSLTSVGGWAKQFLDAGAGAFLGAHWAIDGARAAAFSQAFYPRLFSGVPIAQAVRDARQASRLAGDPSWLAYTLYAHPLACCGGTRG